MGPLGGHVVTSAVAGDGFTIATTENGALYSWGQNNYGQLGLSAMSVSAISLPKPLAAPWLMRTGGFRRIACFSARSWHTIAVVENVYNQKVMQHGNSVQSNGSSSGGNSPQSDSAESSDASFQFNSGVFDRISPAQQPKQPHQLSLEESSVPIWLQQELEAAEFDGHTPPPQPSTPSQQEFENERIQNLEMENERLRNLVAEQEEVIAELRNLMTTQNNNVK